MYRQKNSHEMYDLSQIDTNSRSHLHDAEKENGSVRFGNEETNKTGCYVSSVNGFVLTFLAFVLVALVGVIVHFAGGNKDVDCRCVWDSGNGDGNAGAIVGGTTQSPTTTLQSTSIRPPSTTGGVPDICKELAETGHSEICDLCQFGTTVDMDTNSTQDMVTDSPQSTAVITMTTTTAIPSTSSSPEPEIDVRLPTSLHPYHYTVRLRPHIYGTNESEFYFEGYVKIDMTCVESTSEVMLHTKDLTIKDNGYFSSHDETDQGPLYTGHTYDERREFLIISLTNKTTVGLNYSVELNFTGPLTKDLTGLYLSSFQRGNKTEYLVATQFQATDARSAFPCFDEPGIKSTFDIILERKATSDMITLSNMPITFSVNSSHEEFIADHYQTTVLMPTYLLAFAVCDFPYKNQTTKYNTDFRTYSRAEYLQTTNFSLDVGARLLEGFEDYFDIRYPMPKLDSIALPDFGAAAMENWGLITYRESVMLYDPEANTKFERSFTAIVVSHELAHMWFGNLVSPSWWDDLWLNEGFATFMEHFGLDIVEKDWNMMDLIVIDVVQYILPADSLLSSHPIYVNVSQPSEILELFDDITYFKAASVIRMMWYFLGNETFQRGMRKYLREKSYGNAAHDDLWSALTAQSFEDGKNIDVKVVMDTWIKQMNYPVVNVTTDSDGNIHVTQSRFVINQGNKNQTELYESEFGYMWEIPFTYTTSTEMNFNKNDRDIKWIHLNESEKTIHSSVVTNATDFWIIGNIQQYGFYRVNYDQRNWRAIINQLNKNHTVIHMVNRAQIINDAWALVKAGMLDIGTALDLLSYLSYEKGYIPWFSAVGELEYVDDMLSYTALYGQYQDYMRKSVNTTFYEIGMVIKEDDPLLTIYLQSLITEEACKHGIVACVAEAKLEFQRWIEDPQNNKISPDIKETVLCTAIKESDYTVWNSVYDYFKTSPALEQRLLIRVLGCSKEPWILRKFLSYSMDTRIIRKQDSYFVITAVSANIYGRDIAWGFVQDNWLKLLNYGIELRRVGQVLTYTTRRFNTEAVLGQLNSLRAKYPNFESELSPHFNQAIETVGNNLNWISNNYNQLEEWLIQHRKI